MTSKKFKTENTEIEIVLGGFKKIGYGVFQIDGEAYISGTCFDIKCTTDDSYLFDAYSSDDPKDYESMDEVYDRMLNLLHDNLSFRLITIH